MITSPNKNAFAGLSLGSKLDFFTVETMQDLVGADGEAAQSALNVLIETIALNGQPVISALSTGAAVATGLTGTTSTLKFAVEHTGAWTAATLSQAIAAITVGEAVETENAGGALTGTTLNPAPTVVSPFVTNVSATGATVTVGINTVITLNTL